jgi:hypothetical protein
MQHLQTAMLAAIAKQNIHAVVLVFTIAHAHNDIDTMQLIVNNYAQQFNEQMQTTMRNTLAAAVMEQQSTAQLVQYLQEHMPQLNDSSTGSTSEDLTQAVIARAMLH